MTYPIQNTQIVAQSLAHLTQSFYDKSNVRAMLSVYVAPLQDIENAFFDILTQRTLATATVYALPQTNGVFDLLGALVGYPIRGALSDNDYKSIIYLQIAVNRSVGRATDFSNFAAILARTSPGPASYYDDRSGIYFGFWNMTLSPVVVAQVLTGAVPNGVNGTFAYSTWADGNDFESGSTYAAGAGQGTFGSAYSPATGGLLVAGAQI